MENFQLRPALLQDDGLPLIIKLLDSEYAIIQEMALQTLRSAVHHGLYNKHCMYTVSLKDCTILQLPLARWWLVVRELNRKADYRLLR